MALSLLRHTKPAVAPGLCYGRTDLGLADSFEDDLRGILAALPPVKTIVSSPLIRCHCLANRIAAHVSLDLTLATDWQEMDFGAWEGVAWSAIPRDQIDGWAADFKGYAGHGGESVATFEARVARAIRATPDGALIVTHAGAIKAALALSGEPSGWDARPAFGACMRIRKADCPA